MDIGALLQRLFDSPVVVAVLLCLLFSVANFGIGSVKAWQNGTFEAEAFDVWVKKDGGKLIPIFIYLGLGVAIGALNTSKLPLPSDLVSGGIIGYGLLQAASFVIAAFDSMREALAPNPELKRAKESKAVAVGDPIPNDT